MIMTMATTMNNQIEKRCAWVVFTNQTQLLWLKILKKGFRHCFVIINDGKNWISIDPMSNYTDIAVHNISHDFDLPKWLRSRGHSVIKACLNNNIKKPAPWMFFTCVEACKRILGIHKRSIFTPWQLYRYLLTTKKETS